MSVEATLIRKRARMIFWTWFAVGLGLLFVFGTLGGLAWNAWEGRESRYLIIDCVEPQGQCFREGQERTGNVVKSINDVAIAAAVCAEEPKIKSEPDRAARIVLMRECIQDSIKKGGK